MKTVMYFAGILLLLCAALATPVAIGYGIYSWAIADIEFKFALWSGFKMWLLMLCGIIGYPIFVVANK